MYNFILFAVFVLRGQKRCFVMANPTAEKVFFLCNRGEPSGNTVYKSTEGVETIPETDEDAEAKKSPTMKPGAQDHEGTPILSS